MDEAVERYKFNAQMAEGDYEVKYDQGRHFQGKALSAAVNCIRCNAQCGTFPVDKGFVNRNRARQLAIQAGWICAGPQRWICPPCNFNLLSLHNIDMMVDAVADGIGASTMLGMLHLQAGSPTFYDADNVDTAGFPDNWRDEERDLYMEFMRLASDRLPEPLTPAAAASSLVDRSA